MSLSDKMLLTPEKLKLKQLLSEAIVLLCKSGLSFESELSIQALVGITIDETNVFLVTIEETLFASSAPNESDNNSEKNEGRRKEKNMSSLKCDKRVHVSDKKCNSVETEVNLLTVPSSNEVFSSVKCKKSKYNEIISVCNQDFDEMPILSDEEIDKMTEKGLDEETDEKRCPQDLKFNCQQIQNKRKLQSILTTEERQKFQNRELNIDMRFMQNQLTKEFEDNVQTEKKKKVKVMDDSVVAVKEEFPSMNVSEQLQDMRNNFYLRSNSIFSYGNDIQERNFLFGNSNEFGLNPNDEIPESSFLNIADPLSICYHVLMYEGPFVTVRDVQRRKLRHVSANVIKSLMNELTVDGLGVYQTLCLGIMVFYKCPPSVIRSESLDKYKISLDLYERNYNQPSYINSANRHSESYWQRVKNSSPYPTNIQ